MLVKDKIIKNFIKYSNNNNYTSNTIQFLSFLNFRNDIKILIFIKKNNSEINSINGFYFYQKDLNFKSKI